MIQARREGCAQTIVLLHECLGHVTQGGEVGFWIAVPPGMIGDDEQPPLQQITQVCQFSVHSDLSMSREAARRGLG